jgi:hypothetical protein
MTGMPSPERPARGREKLSPTQRRALALLYRRTMTGGWVVSGQYAVRTNTMFSLEDRGLARTRLWGGPENPRWECQITEGGKELARLLAE